MKKMKMTPEDRERIKAMSKEHPMPPIVVDQMNLNAAKGVLCRRCGNIIREPYDRYCAVCGQRIKPYAHGGAYGWTARTADFVWDGISKDRALIEYIKAGNGLPPLERKNE